MLSQKLNHPHGKDNVVANPRYAFEPVTPPPPRMREHSSLPQKGTCATHSAYADGNIFLQPNGEEEDDAFRHMGDSPRKLRAGKAAMKQKAGAFCSPSSFAGIPGGPTGDAGARISKSLQEMLLISCLKCRIHSFNTHISRRLQAIPPVSRSARHSLARRMTPSTPLCIRPLREMSLMLMRR